MPCPPPPEELAKLLQPHRWEKRVVLVCAAEYGLTQQQREHFAKAKEGLKERDILVIEVQGQRFEVRLYGKDGGKS